MLRLLPGVLLPGFTLPGSFVGAITSSFFSIFAATLGVLAPRLSVAYDALDDAPDSLDVAAPLFFASEEYVG